MRPDLSLCARRPSFRRRVHPLVIAALSLATALALIAVNVSATRLGTAPRADAAAKEQPAGAEAPQPVLFRGWDRPPDLALVLSGQEHGYLNPCGCSPIQYGGLPRRYNFMQQLRQRSWPVAAVDLGDLIDPAVHRGPQGLLKYQASMKALKAMSYLAVGLGQLETEMPLLETLGQYALNDAAPRIVAANLKDRDTNFAGAVGAWMVGGDGKSSVKVGVVGIVGPTVREKVPAQDPALSFDSTTDTLTSALKSLQAEKPELYVLLYQGSVPEARACAKVFKQFHVILCLSKETEPSDKPDRVNDTLIVSVGHKGRYVGVVGAYRTGNPKQPFDLKYQLVMLGPEYETKAGQEKDNPVMALLEAYTQEVKEGNYLARYPRRKHALQVEYPKAEYVGSEACAGCHAHATKIWSGHAHAHAFDALVKAQKPALRQFDGECVVCHTVGFGHLSGYQDEAKTAHLKHVSCENCHGPGSLHVDLGKKTPAKMLALMNPFKPQPNETPPQEAQRLLRIDLDCQKCHDIDNDVSWNFAKKWPQVIHRTPKKN